MKLIQISMLVFFIICIKYRYKVYKASTLRRQTVTVNPYSLKTGDVVLNNNLNQVTAFFGGSHWNHIGVVYVYNDVVYVLDMCDHRANGIRMTPIKEYIRRAKGNVAVRQLKGPTLDGIKLESYVKSMWNTTFARDFVFVGVSRFLDGMIKLPVESTKRYGKYCAEFITDLYKHMGVVVSDTESSTLLPKDYADDLIITTPQYTFGDIIHM